ncbi:MAG TPA: histidine phosphatase family protein [Gemmatimonadales bacterium]|nr:histidine phosphatase family protein [Gemmatimonadales bacterium]
MLRIILARHGRIVWDFATAIPGRAFAAWLEGENHAPIDPSHRPPAELQHLVRAADGVVASPLRRSLESASLLAPTAPPLIDACFREAELPSAVGSGLRLRADIWAGLARTAWFCGWSPGVESFKAARGRAARAAGILAAQAGARGPIALVGHGLMNILIAAQLRRAGWSGPLLPPQRHWGFAVYERVAA